MASKPPQRIQYLSIPVSIFKEVYEITIPALVEMINKSLREGCAQGIKHSVIDPLQYKYKTYNLDPESKKNYRPVNNLIFFQQTDRKNRSHQN